MTWKLKTLFKAGAAIGATCLGLAAYPQFAQGADHIDGGAVTANPQADINDIYAWMSGDAANLNLAMSVGGGAPITFDDSVVYNFYVTRGAAAGDPSVGTVNHVRCAFVASGAQYECWALNSSDEVQSYFTGTVDELADANGDGFRVFVGPRNDAFVMDLGNFFDTTDTVAAAIGGLPPETFDDNGCLADADLGGTVAGILLAGPAEDFFAEFTNQHIVIQLPKSLLEGDGDTLSVWASTSTR